MKYKWLPLLCAGILVAACSKNEGATAEEAASAATATPAAAEEGAPAAAAEMTTVTREVVLATAPADLWQQVGDFASIHVWHPAIVSTEIVKGENNVVGAHRKVTLGDGAAVVEELAERDDAGMTLSYTIVDAPLPVADYRSTITVVSEGDGSKMSWSGTFKPVGDTPPAEVEALIGGIYQAGLDSLAKPAAE